MSPYSPERRTALVLCGTGAHGAYHAGVLRALQEAGVKIDVVAGHGIGAGGAGLTAIGGSSRLWEDAGIWRSPRATLLYAWKWTAVAPPIILAVLTILLLATVVVVAAGVALPFWWAATLIATFAVAAGACAAIVWQHASSARRASGRWWWRLFGAPVDAESARALFCGAIWDLIRGAAPTARTSRATPPPARRGGRSAPGARAPGSPARPARHDLAARAHGCRPRRRPPSRCRGAPGRA